MRCFPLRFLFLWLAVASSLSAHKSGGSVADWGHVDTIVAQVVSNQEKGDSPNSDSKNIRVSLDGILARSPGTFSKRLPYIEDSNKLLCKLVLPEDDYFFDAIADHIGKEVQATGELEIKNVKQKDGSTGTEYHLRIHNLKLKNQDWFIVGPMSPDGPWVAVSMKAGLKLFNTTTNRGKNIYPHWINIPEGAPLPANMYSTVEFSSCGKFVWTKQNRGANSPEGDLWRLEDLKKIDLNRIYHSRAPIFLEFGGFSPDGKFIVTHGYGARGSSEESLSDMLIVFHTDSGKEIARVTFEQAARPRHFSFLPRGKLLAVVVDSTLTIIDLSNGKQLAAIQTSNK